jgi:hypothetical protein
LPNTQKSKYSEKVTTSQIKFSMLVTHSDFNINLLQISKTYFTYAIWRGENDSIDNSLYRAQKGKAFNFKCIRVFSHKALRYCLNTGGKCRDWK